MTSFAQSKRAVKARRTKARPVRHQTVKRAPHGWFGRDDESVTPAKVQQPSSLDELDPDVRKRLEDAVERELEFKLTGVKERPKLSKTFEEVVLELGVDEVKEQEVLLSVAFQYAKNIYRTPYHNRSLSELKYSIIEALLEQDSVTPYEMMKLNPAVWGRRFNNTYRDAIYRLKTDGFITEEVPIQISDQDFDEVHANGVPYSYNYLSADFKREFIMAAVAWDSQRGEDAKLSLETHARIAALG